MSATKMALLFAALCKSGIANAEDTDMTFRLFACVSDPDSVVMTFKSEAGNTRRVVFMDKYKEFALKSPTTIGVLKWDKTIAVHIIQSEPGGDKKLMSIEYRDPDGSTRSFEAGLIDEACLAKVKNRYDKLLTFKDN